MIETWRVCKDMFVLRLSDHCTNSVVLYCFIILLSDDEMLIFFTFYLLAEFIEDIELMFSNCFEYNPRNTSEAKAGTRLQAFFHIQAQKLGLPITSGNVDHAAPAAKKSRI